MLSFIFTVILTAKAITYEKETGIKEAMKLMGMKLWIYWLSWYIKTFVLLLPSLIFMIVSYKIKVNLNSGGQASIIDKTDPVLFTLFMFLYASSSITFTFMCSTFFKKANSAAAGVGIIWFFSYLPYIFISLRYEKMNLASKILALFVNNLAMSEGIQLIGMFEGKGTGINFSNWTTGISVDDTFNLFQVMIVMFFNNFIHLGLLYYFESIFPGDHGIGKPWYFPFSCLISKRSVSDQSIPLKTVNISQNVENEMVEETINSKKIGVKIENIIKTFRQLGNLKTAVNNFTLEIEPNELMGILGHNGAGKTTLINILTGILTPDDS